MKRKIYKLLLAAKQGLFILVMATAGTVHAQTYTLTYTGAIQTLVLPSSGSWGIQCWGADGGDVTAGPGGGGKGGYTNGAYFVSSPGTPINIFVGGKGASVNGSSGPSGNGGWNGGGGGGYCGKSGGGGGGATDVRVGGIAATDRVIVAGGGGGAAYYTLLAVGGDGGAQMGGYGDAMTSGNVLTVGGGGAGANGGLPGLSTNFFASTDGNATGGGGGGNSPGGFGQPGIGGGPGGTGGSLASGSTGSSGGGGGGYAGGAGGTQTSNAGVGGGGGSGYITGLTNAITVANGQPGFIPNPDLLGNGMVIITRLCNISLVPSQNPICIGNSITLTTDAVSGITWGGSAATGTIISVTPTVTTNYSVTGTSTANCQTTNVITVTVNPLPIIGSVVTPSILCVGSTATINANGANTYTLNTGLSGSSPTVMPGITTIYTIAATSIYGCFNTNTVSVPVNSNSLTVSSSSPVCSGVPVMLMVSGATSYSWSTGSMFSSIPVSPTGLTTYSVSGNDIYDCVLSNGITLSPAPLPAVTVSASKSTICKGESIILTALGATTYTWNDGSVASTLSRTLSVDIPYYFTVTGQDPSGCSKTVSITVNVARCLGVNEIERTSLDVAVMPNPGTGLFNLQINSIKDHLIVSVYNSLGMLIKSESASTGNNALDLQNEKAGIYFIYISNKDDNSTRVLKLIKE